MFAVRLAAASLAALALAPAAGAAHFGVSAPTTKRAKGLGAPQGLRAFLLRADEPAVHEFPRTPAFAWKPVKGAKRYEFTLSTSALSAGSGLVCWSTVDGATSYEIWYQNANVSGRSKLFYTTTNVADEREYYAFHQFAPFTTTVIWRVRAVRAVYGAAQNKLPAGTDGPWGP